MALIKSGGSADLLDITDYKAAKTALFDPDGNPLAVSEPNTPPLSISGLTSFGVNDGRPVPLRADRLGGQALAWHNPLLSESFEGTTVHSSRWQVTATTMAAAQTTVGGLLFNSAGITTINTGYMIKSTRLFAKQQRAPMQLKARARFNHVNNSVMEIGFGDASTFNGANTSGAYFQRQANGSFVPVLTFNGVDATGASIPINNTDYYTLDVLLDDDSASFVVQNSSTEELVSKQTLQLPVSGARLLSVTQVAVLARLYNTGVAPATAPQMIVTDLYALMLDANLNIQIETLQALQGRSAIENPLTGAQLPLFANSAAPANATLSNTTAGYSTPGGLFSFSAVAGAATDYALFGFQVPSPLTLVVTGLSIETWNTGAAVATSPTLLVWGVATQLTAVSLATAGHARLAIGAQSLPVGAAIGAKAERIEKTFRSPLICAPGRFFDVILRMPVAAATAAQVIQGHVSVEGYFI